MNMDKNILEVSVKDIIPNRYQPRVNFEEEGLSELAESIKQFGIIQPLIVRKQNDKYEIIAGERRYKAAMQAGLQTIPVILSEMNEEQTAEVALSENIQRKNLSVIEEAKSLKNLLDRGYLTQEQLSSKMGVSQIAIADKLKLLELDEEVQEALINEQISERHARPLITLTKDDQKKWLQKIINERLNVRDLEIELKKIKSGEVMEDDIIPLVNINPDIENIMNNAEDINRTREPHDVASFLIPEGGKQEEHKTTFVIPEPPEKMPNKFFNFLEDEEANMNVSAEEEKIDIFNQETTPLATPVEILDDYVEKSEDNTMNNTLTVSNFEFNPTSELQNNKDISSFKVEEPLNLEENNNEISFESMNTVIENSPINLEANTTPTSDVAQFVIDPIPLESSPNTELEVSNFNFNNPIENVTSSPTDDIAQFTINNSSIPQTPDPSSDLNVSNFIINSVNEDNSIESTNNDISNFIINEPQTFSESASLNEVSDFILPSENNTSSAPAKSIFFHNEENDPIVEEQPKQEINNNIEEIIPMPEETLVDPLDSVITLEPDYASKQEEIAGTDLKTAINTVRNTVNDLELSGFNIEIEEADLEDQYYINIRIMK
ncbi:MAG: ParB/RepB/Spo0J family partition protein [Bacilli bacterium]|nr:ParB/RepB/Spo0J family partition protein [Bacilli bacterium]